MQNHRLGALQRIGQPIGQFARDRSGAIAPLFAAAIIPIILAAGIGLDVARQISARNNLQDALDATGLALAHMPANTPLATLNASADTWVRVNLRDRNIGGLVVTATPSTGQVTVTATGQVGTTLMALAGFKQMSVQAQSTVRWAPSRLELALVLDNTGSMADNNKLTSLKSAASSLVDSLTSQWSIDPSGLKIGVVPFTSTVNVGAQYQSASWISGTQPAAYGADLFNAPTDRFSLYSKMNIAWGGCVEDRPMPYDTLDTSPGATAPGASYPAPNFVPYFQPDEPDYNNYTYYRASYITDPGNNYLAQAWNGTGWDQKKYWQVSQFDPTKYNPAVTGSGPNSGCGVWPLLRLTNDMTQVKAELGHMIASGNTHIPMGLIWGWHLLSPNAPFGDGAPYGNTATKVVVLVTDGENTYNYGANYNGYNQSDYTGIGYAWQQRISTAAGSYTDPKSALDDRLKQLCKNMNAAGIVVYTVPVEVTDPTVKGLLQNCASSPDKYIDVTNSSGLDAAFSNIAGSIGVLRVAR